MTNTITPATRKQILLDYLKGKQGEKRNVKDIATDLRVPKQYFITDIRKWMDTPEYAYIHREGSGVRTDVHRYWYDPTQAHAPLPVRQKRTVKKASKPKTPKVSSNLPEKVTPSFVRPGGRQTRSMTVNGQTMAMVIFQEGTHVILLDDQDRLIRGRLVE